VRWFDQLGCRCRCRPSLVCLKKGDRLDTAKLRAAIQDGDLEDEEVSDQFASQLLDERASSSSGTTCGKVPILDNAFTAEIGHRFVRRPDRQECRKTGRGEMCTFARRVGVIGDWQVPEQGGFGGTARLELFTHR
jgi:hypothetical protein